MTIALTYNLCSQCGNARPFCRKCVNAFCISGPCKSRCKDGPATICLVPRMVGEMTECLAKCLDDLIPRYWLATFLLDDVLYGPWKIETGASCLIGGQFSLPNTITFHGDGNFVFNLDSSSFNMLKDSGGSVWTRNFTLDQTLAELLEGSGCNRVLTFTNTSVHNVTGGVMLPSDGSIVTLYPIGSSLP